MRALRNAYQCTKVNECINIKLWLSCYFWSCIYCYVYFSYSANGIFVAAEYAITLSDIFEKNVQSNLHTIRNSGYL